MTAALTVRSADLGRILANALAFCPARSKFPAVQLRSGGFTMTALASDTYTIGRSWCSIDSSPTGTIALALDDAKLLEKLARMDHKGTGKDGVGNGILEIGPNGEWLTFSPSQMGEPLTVPGIDPALPTAYGSYSELWERCSELLERLSDSEPCAPPEAALFDPALLARFAKVRADSDESSEGAVALDMLFQDGFSPILIRIGSNFRGAVMPIDRVANRTQQGTGGHW